MCRAFSCIPQVFITCLGDWLLQALMEQTELTFAPNTQWTEYYSRGKEIQEYYERVCQDHGVTDHIRLRTQVIGAKWTEDQFRWEVKIRDLKTGKGTSEHADFFVSCQGRINKPS